MNKSYLDADSPRINYSSKNTYIEKIETEDIYDYSILPEEYNIFPLLDSNLLEEITDGQKELLFSIYRRLKSLLKYIYNTYGVVKILPKLDLYVDSEGAIILNWAYTMFRIYFDIEKNVIKSFYGLVIKESENSIQTRTEIITKENCEEITGEIIQYIFNQT